MRRRPPSRTRSHANTSGKGMRYAASQGPAAATEPGLTLFTPDGRIAATPGPEDRSQPRPDPVVAATEGGALCSPNALLRSGTAIDAAAAPGRALERPDRSNRPWICMADGLTRSADPMRDMVSADRSRTSRALIDLVRTKDDTVSCRLLGLSGATPPKRRWIPRLYIDPTATLQTRARQTNPHRPKVAL